MSELRLAFHSPLSFLLSTQRILCYALLLNVLDWWKKLNKINTTRAFCTRVFAHFFSQFKMHRRAFCLLFFFLPPTVFVNLQLKKFISFCHNPPPPQKKNKNNVITWYHQFYYYGFIIWLLAWQHGASSSSSGPSSSQLYQEIYIEAISPQY